jgi:hypothetical protein
MTEIDLLKFAELSVAAMALAGSMWFAFSTLPTLLTGLMSTYSAEQSRERAAIMSILSLQDSKSSERHRELIDRFEELSDVLVKSSRCHESDR